MSAVSAPQMLPADYLQSSHIIQETSIVSEVGHVHSTVLSFGPFSFNNPRLNNIAIFIRLTTYMLNALYGTLILDSCALNTHSLPTKPESWFNVVVVFFLEGGGGLLYIEKYPSFFMRYQVM